MTFTQSYKSQSWHRNISYLFCMLILAQSMSVAGAQQTSLTIFSSTDTDAIAPLLSAFEESRLGLQIHYQEVQTSELYDLMSVGDGFAPINEQKDENALDPAISENVDLVISSAMDLQVQLVNSGNAYRFETPNTRLVPDWAKWRNELYGFTFEPVAMIYNKAAFQNRELPKTRSELASMIRDDPDFFDQRIGSYDIRQSGVGYLFAAQDVRYGYQYARLLENFGRARMRTFCCTSLMVAGVRSGQLIMAYNVLGSYVLESLRNEENIGIHLMDDYSLVMTRTVYIPKTAKNKEAAVAFIDFLLSDYGQGLIADHSALIPINQDKAMNNSKSSNFLNRQSPMLPIRLGTGLLTYLDQRKKEAFLNEWTQAVDPQSLITNKNPQPR